MFTDQTSNNAYNFKNIRVALVDDNRHMLNLGIAMLNGLGVGQVLAERNGVLALSSGLLETADILVLDWLLKPLSCVDFIRQVRDASASPKPFIPIIALRGFTQSLHVAQTRDLGATEFLGLPISPQTLYDRLVHVIKHPRPFIDAPDFFGPDRRRRTDEDYDGEERRQSQPTVVDHKNNGRSSPKLRKAG